MLNHNRQLSIVNCQLLYDSAHLLLHLGEDGRPIYADRFRQLNAEVVRLLHELYPVKSSSDREEAEICLALLMGFSATIYNVDEQEIKLQSVLERAFNVLQKIDTSLLKCRLLLYCYAGVQDEELLEKAKEIIVSWGGRELTEEEKEMIEMFNELIMK